MALPSGWLRFAGCATKLKVAADPAPISEGATAGRTYNALRYYRLHGSPRMYWSNYSRAYLRDLAAVVEGLKPTVWIIFDNTAAGYATANALQFRALTDRPKGTDGERMYVIRSRMEHP